MAHRKYSSASKTYFKKFAASPANIYYAWKNNLNDMNNEGAFDQLQRHYAQGLGGAASNVVHRNLNEYLKNTSGWDKATYYIQALLSGLGLDLGKNSKFNRINSEIENISKNWEITRLCS